MFIICMHGLLATLNDKAPKWQLDQSLIGINPGVGLRPLPKDLNIGSLIWYKANDTKQVDYWTDLLSEFLQRN